MKNINIIAHDMRSTHNVGSLMRTCEGLGINKLYLSGYTPYPRRPRDTRLPHIVEKLDKQIQKTALGAQNSLSWDTASSIVNLVDELRKSGSQIVALEQTTDALELQTFKSSADITLILGTEVDGLPESVIRLTDYQLIIPMFGDKESFNVVQAAAMAMFHLRFN